MDERALTICRCEEITKGEILDSIEGGARTLNEVKRITRAGMGLCQGKTCSRLISQLLWKRGKGVGVAFPIPPTFRSPVRPVKVGELAEEEREGDDTQES